MQYYTQSYLLNLFLRDDPWYHLIDMLDNDIDIRWYRYIYRIIELDLMIK